MGTVALSLPPNVACEQSPDYKEEWLKVNHALRAWSCEETASSGVALFVNVGDLVPLDSEGHFYNIDRLHFSIEGAERLGSELALLVATLLGQHGGGTSMPQG